MGRFHTINYHLYDYGCGAVSNSPAFCVRRIFSEGNTEEELETFPERKGGNASKYEENPMKKVKIDATFTKVLGAHTASKDETWREVLRNPWEYVDEGLLMEKEKQVRKMFAESKAAGEKLSIAWSGGKDSLVLMHLAKGLIKDCHMAAYQRNHYFDDTAEWFKDHMPRNLTLLPINMDHSKMIKYRFPDKASDTKKWLLPKWKVFELYHAQAKLDWTVMGRRRSDGNRIVKERFKNVKGLATWNQIADWSNEEVAAYLVKYRINLPPDYRFDEGFKYGLCPWLLTGEKMVRLRQPELMNRI